MTCEIYTSAVVAGTTSDPYLYLLNTSGQVLLNQRQHGDRAMRAALLLLGIAALAGAALLLRNGEGPTLHREPPPALRPTHEPEVITASDPADEVRREALRRDADAALKEYRKRREDGAPIEEVRRAEAELAALPPNDLVALLLHESGPLIRQFLIDTIDLGLERDRNAWENALVIGIEQAAETPARLESMTELALDRVKDEERREHIANFLMDWASSDRLLLMTARFACGEALPAIANSSGPAGPSRRSDRSSSPGRPADSRRSARSAPWRSPGSAPATPSSRPRFIASAGRFVPRSRAHVLELWVESATEGETWPRLHPHAS